MTSSANRVECSQLSEDWHDGRKYGPDGELFTGECYENYQQTGKPEFAGEYLDGLQHGFHRSWYPNGSPTSEDQYWRGRLHGISRKWYISGILEGIMLSCAGFVLEWKHWDESGGLLKHEKISPEEQSILDEVLRTSDYPPLVIPNELPLDCHG